MTQRKLLVVVDNNATFAVHVWRYLTGPMEFGLGADALESFERTTPDGSLKLRWFGPHYEAARAVQDGGSGDAMSYLRKRFKQQCTDHDREVWCILDVRGLRGSDRTRPKWEDYHKEFLSWKSSDPSRIWVMSSYGDRDWRSAPAIRAKVVETLDSFARKMDLPFDKEVGRSERAEDEFNVLVTGAGFELADKNAYGEAIGFPTTAALLHAMNLPGEPQNPDAEALTRFPLRWPAGDIESAVENYDLDAWWDAMFAFVMRNDVPEHRGFDELSLREAFRHSFLEYDFGHQRQSLIAAKLGWDYWLTTNYARFADRAADMVGNTAKVRRRWRAITTSIEADAVAPDLACSTTDLARKHRILVKLHGDIGHVWTMAIAGKDKLPNSSLQVRPQLHRMYAAAESMLVASLWGRANRPRLCRWSVVGHGLRDKALVRLIAAVIQRSPPSIHHIIVPVGGESVRSKDTLEHRLAELEARFDEALGASQAAELREAKTSAGEPRVEIDKSYFMRSALEYMTTISTVHPASEEKEMQESGAKKPDSPLQPPPSGPSGSPMDSPPDPDEQLERTAEFRVVGSTDQSSEQDPRTGSGNND